MTAIQLMLPVDLQRSNEYLLTRKHLDKYITEAIMAKPEWAAMVVDGVAKVQAWLDHWTAPFTDQCTSEAHHASKSARLEQLKQLDLEELVRSLIVGSAHFQRPDTFVSASSMLAYHLGFDDRRNAIVTVAELCAVLCWTGAFTLWKDTPDMSMMFQSRLEFPQELTDAINRGMYPPPMVCEPEDVTSNYESPYLTFNDCRVLGKQNGHAGDLCLDVMNTQMKVALKLDLEFLSTVDEPEPKDWDTIREKITWDQFKYDSYCVYSLLAKQGNRFWLDHKVDKRGRLYVSGYHVSTQSSPFKKSCIELWNEELVEGVPK